MFWLHAKEIDHTGYLYIETSAGEVLSGTNVLSEDNQSEGITKAESAYQLMRLFELALVLQYVTSQDLE